MLLLCLTYGASFMMTFASAAVEVFSCRVDRVRVPSEFSCRVDRNAQRDEIFWPDRFFVQSICADFSLFSGTKRTVVFHRCEIRCCLSHARPRTASADSILKLESQQKKTNNKTGRPVHTPFFLEVSLGVLLILETMLKTRDGSCGA